MSELHSRESCGKEGNELYAVYEKAMQLIILQ